MQIPFQQIVEGIVVVSCSAVLFLKNNGILKGSNRLEKRLREQRLDLLKYGIYVTKIPMLDKLYSFNEYIANGGNHGVIEHMKPIIRHNKDTWWSVYEREKNSIVTDERYRDYYNKVITEIKAYCPPEEKKDAKDGTNE